MMVYLRRLTVAFVAAFGVTALAAAYWSVIRSEGLLAREDNPRLVDAELAVQRGQILDRDNRLLALSSLEESVFVRQYPYPNSAPVVGYYSLRYGVGGIEAAQDDVLRGDAFLTPAQEVTSRWLHRDQTGGDVRLTLDLDLQQAAERALRGRRGALVIIDVPSGDVLALTSSPTYDPNFLDEQWDTLLEDPDGPLVNRVTQGLYPPGTALQSVLLGAALNAGVVDLDDSVDSVGLAVDVDGTTLGCGVTPDGAVETLLDAYQWACPAPFEAVGEALGRERIDGALTDFGLGLAPPLGLPSEAVAESAPPDAMPLSVVSVGQGDLSVTPLQMGLVAASVANLGEAPSLRLVDAVRAPGGGWKTVSSEGHPRAAIAPDNADRLAAAMRAAVRSGGASEAALPDAAVSGHAGLAVADSEDGTFNAWFIGFVAYGNDDNLAIAVLVEDAQAASEAASIGGEALGAALDVSR